MRQCNNPKPENGGKYCSGKHKTYVSCNTQNCPIGELDFRDEQCVRLKGYAWIANHYPTDQCKLFCRNGGQGYVPNQNVRS